MFPQRIAKLTASAGKQFAGLSIGAMIADNAPQGRALEIIFEDIIKDAIRRKPKGGKGARTVPAAVQGYLEELALFITDPCRAGGLKGHRAEWAMLPRQKRH
jgi:hypothetical protein